MEFNTLSIILCIGIAVAAIVFFFIVAIITFIQVRVTSKKEVEI